jgi:hypothetical protein
MLKFIRPNVPLIITSLCLFLVVGCETPQHNIPQNGSLLKAPTSASKKNSNSNNNINDVEGLRQRIVDVYAKYWPLISSEYQHEQLPDVLGDPMYEIRIFGIERVGVFLRDGEATEEELQLVVDRLMDEDPSVRLAASKILPEINVVGLAEHVANVMANETSLDVVEQELIYFQTNSHSKAIQPTIDRMQQDPDGAAANALIFLLNNNEVTDKTQRKILRIVLKSRQKSDLPSLITLEAMLGSDLNKRGLINMLDHPDESIQISVAKGFAYAGFEEPLIERADNSLMYMYALSALQKNVDIDSFIKLLSVRKENEPNWDAAAFSIASSLNTRDLLRADDMLKRLKLDELRLSILNDVWKNAAEKSEAAQKAIARRIVPLMVDRGDPIGALQLLDTLDIDDESLNDDDLITLIFTTAINASAWDAAADARPEPSLWITEWEQVVNSDPTAANVIKKQIVQRFRDLLTREQMILLDISQKNEPTIETP